MIQVLASFINFIWMKVQDAIYHMTVLARILDFKEDYFLHCHGWHYNFTFMQKSVIFYVTLHTENGCNIVYNINFVY